MLEQIIVQGTIDSLVYALMALGFTLIYGVSGIVNMAHGAYILIGAYIFISMDTFFSSFFPAQFLYLVPVLAFIIAPIVTGIIGSIFYRLTIHQIIGDQIGIIVTSLAACIAFQQIVGIVFGSAATIRYPLPTLMHGYFTVLGVQVTNDRAAAAVMSILLFAGVWIFVAKTRWGKAMRALSQDIEAAMLMGVNVERMYMLVSAIAAGFACIAAVFFASSSGAATGQMWLYALAISFSIVILGGLGNIKGSIIGAFIFGYSIAIIRQVLPGAGGMVTAFPFIVMIIVLIIRPKGLFGKRIEME